MSTQDATTATAVESAGLHEQQAAARRLAIEAARLAAGGHCEDVVVLDLRGVSPVCDYFVIATGTSALQMRSIAAQIVDQAEGLGEAPFSPPRVDETGWIILDFVTVVVHLFDARHREYYSLELLWGDAPTIAWDQAGA